MTSRVLIVDDSRQMREFIRSTLGDGVAVIGECEDGSEALEAYIRLRPDWVLMDVNMKKMDGITATRQIISADPKARIMIVTNHTDVKLRWAASNAGAKRYVLKENLPTILDILAETIV